MEIGAAENSQIQKNQTQIYDREEKMAVEKSLLVKGTGEAEKGGKEPFSPEFPRYDNYVKGESSDEKAAGIYKVGQDEEGNPKVLFEDPLGSEELKGSETEKKEKDEKEKCTVNTDRVDQEIRMLKEERDQLKRQLEQASGNPAKTESINSRLSAVESRLMQKDNDTYRKQNASYSFGENC